MFFNKKSGFWEQETFIACSFKEGQIVTIGAGRGPWSVIKVKVEKVEAISSDRCKMYAKEID